MDNNKKERWLINYFKDKMIDIKDVFYAFYKEDKVYYILKSDVK